MKGINTMADYYWCHGPTCHKDKTQDRIRGSKGSKVLRTRKIKQHTESSWYRPNDFMNYFCSNGCYNQFAHKHIERIIAIAPRNEPLETPIDDPKKVTHQSNYTYPDGTQHTWTSTEIKERGVDTAE